MDKNFSGQIDLQDAVVSASMFVKGGGNRSSDVETLKQLLGLLVGNATVVEDENAFKGSITSFPMGISSAPVLFSHFVCVGTYNEQKKNYVNITPRRTIPPPQGTV